MNRIALLALMLLWPSLVRAQSLGERFEAAAKRDQSAAISLLEKRIDDRKSLLEAAKRGPINQAKNDYSSATTPDGKLLHNFSFRTAADRKELTTRYQKQLTEVTRNLKDVKASTAWPLLAKSVRQLEVGDFVWLQGEYRLLFKESDAAAWVEKQDTDDPGSFFLTGADLSRYADDKVIDFVDPKKEYAFFVKGTKAKPESLRLQHSEGQTLYELEMISLEQLTKMLPAGIRIQKVSAKSDDDSEKDLPTPGVAKS